MGEMPGRLVLPEDTIFQIPAMMHDAIDRQGQGGGPTGRQGPALVLWSPSADDGDAPVSGWSPSVPRR